jgi:hypothetical protein
METNEQLKQKAELLLEAYNLHALRAVVHGSFYLDLMVCPDIDAYIPAEQCADIFTIGRTLYQNDLTNEIYLMKGSMIGEPEAQHIQVRTNVEAEKARWKIDIWVYPSRTIQENMKEMNRLKTLLSAESRAAILELKRALIQPNGFSPKYSGFLVYIAYLDKGFRGLADIREYLRREGIQFV